MPKPRAVSPADFQSFGELLKFLRRRAGLTQNELALAVGYHYTQLSKLEHNQRLPDRTTISARFVPALLIDDQPDWAARLADLAESGRETGPLKAADSAAPPSQVYHLPSPLTPLIGRAADVTELKAILSERSNRLVTLLGPSGIGKTRLGLQAAAELEKTFADGVAFVELAAVSDPAGLLPMLAQVLGLAETAKETLESQLQRYLREMQLLLVLDNFEQITPAAPLVTRLLTAAPGLQILVTSREVLNVYGERRFWVKPLPVPNLAQLPGQVEALTQFAAVELFCRRAQASKPAFQLSPANARPVAEVCARLDGLPLAIELAAARINVFSPDAMLTQLNNRTQWLAAKNRDLPVRQQTLWGAIDWSFNLLEQAEQRVFMALAVFVGGFTLMAARDVLSILEAPGASEDWVLALVNKSLVWQLEDEEGQPRFRMLETLHEYARARLEAAPAIQQSAAQAHAAYYLALAELAAQELQAADRVDWLEHLESEHENLRAALQWLLLERGDAADAGPRLAIALWQYWLVLGHMTEGRFWLEAAYNTAAGPQRVTLAQRLGEACLNLGEFDASQTFFEQSLTLAREIG